MPLPQLNTNFNVLQPDVGQQYTRAAQFGNYLTQQKSAALNRREKEAELENVLTKRKREAELFPIEKMQKTADAVNSVAKVFQSAIESGSEEVGDAILKKFDPDLKFEWKGGFGVLTNEKTGVKVKVRQGDAANVVKMLASPDILKDHPSTPGISNLQHAAAKVVGSGGEFTLGKPPKTVESKIADTKKEIAAGVKTDPLKTEARQARSEQRVIEKEEAATLKDQQAVNSKITKLDLAAKKLVSTNVVPSFLAEFMDNPAIAGKKLSKEEVEEVILLYNQEVKDLLPSATQGFRDKYKGIQETTKTFDFVPGKGLVQRK